MSQEQAKPKNKVQIKNWDIAKIHWTAQAVANLFFGLSLAIIVLSYTGFSKQATGAIVLLYICIYCFVFVPMYGLLPIFLFRKPKKILDKINKKQKVEQKEIAQAIEMLLGLPLKISIIIPITVWFGFGLGGFILWKGLVTELTPLIELVLVSCMSIGFCVGLMHSFLNYIFLDNYLRSRINYLGLAYSGKRQDIKTRKISLGVKIFLMVLLVSFASQISMWAVLSAKIGVSSVEELKSGFVHASVVSVLTLIAVFIIAVLFSQNITYPLKKLIDWSGKVIKGETKEKISIITDDEISEMVEYLKEMVGELESAKEILEIRVEARTIELKQLTEKQEDIIEERTRELQKKIKELEKFQKLAVGRELRMIELKKEIKKLKK